MRPRCDASSKSSPDATPRPGGHVPYPDVWVVVPAFNEATVIRQVTAALHRVFRNIVVVDDGSSDETASEARGAGVVVVRHALNLGQGAALQTGVQYALARGAGYIATFDADGQHQVEDLARMLELLRSGEIDIVLGSRFLGQAPGIGSPRRLALRLATIMTSVTTGVRLTDAHNGLRVMTAEAAHRLHIVHDEMAHASELISQIGRLALRYREVPVTISYTSYSLRKGQRLTNGFRIVTDLIVGRLIR